MSKSKTLPPPPTTDLTSLLRQRHTTATDVTSTESVSPATESRSEKPTGAKTVRRSWYMLASTATDLSTAVDNLHYTTRAPKHEVLAALISVALDNIDSVQERLKSGQ